jgi:protease YdgD
MGAVLTDEPGPDAGRRRRGRALAVLALAALGAAGPLAAQTVQDMRRIPPGVLHPGIGAEDPRRAVDPAAEPWRGLGRVQTELDGRCTGALVGPRTVLTAAHCLMAPRSGRLVQPGSVHFMLGYHLGAWAAHARVVAYAIGPGFAPDAVRPGPSGADWALLTLDRPMTGADGPARPLPLLRDAAVIRPGTPLMLGGYQRDRPEVLLADTACRALGHERRPSGHTLLVHDCAGTCGASGAPLLARGRDGRWGVAGVASTIGPAGAAPRGLAVPAMAVGVETEADAQAARP